jgi:hypothetical protein
MRDSALSCFMGGKGHCWFYGWNESWRELNIDRGKEKTGMGMGMRREENSIGYLESFKDKTRTSVEEIPQYCRQYSAISKPLFDAGKIQSGLRSAWFLQGLLESSSNEFSIKQDLDDDDESKMDFDTLMHQVLQLCRSKVTMKKARKVGFKTPKNTALVNEMQRCLSHGRDEDASDLMRKMKVRAGATVTQISPDMKEITDAMKRMTINVDNLVSCVSMTAGRFAATVENTI